MSAKLTGLTEQSAPTLDDLAYIVDDPAGTPLSNKLSLTRLGGLLARNAVGGRLTLTSGTPVTTADVSAATSVFFTPYSASQWAGLVSLYDGTRWRLYTFTERTLALGTLTANLPYDIFLYDNAGTLTLESLAWSSETARATALTTQDGIYVKTGATTRRYLGTFRTTSTTQTEDSGTKRFLWNYYNRRDRPLRRQETTATWTYTVANAWRQANAAAANQLDLVVGVLEDPIELEVLGGHSAAAVASSAAAGIGEDSTTVLMAGVTLMRVTNGITADGEVVSLRAAFRGFPASVGKHSYTWIERVNTTTTNTFYGDQTGTTATLNRTGMFGIIRG